MANTNTNIIPKNKIRICYAEFDSMANKYKVFGSENNNLLALENTERKYA